MKKNGTDLEKEFGKFVNLHKFAIICSALELFEDTGIYDTYLFKDKYEEVAGEGVLKARNVAKLLLDNSFKTKEDNELFENCYNYCYDEFKQYMRDDYNATKDLMED